MNVLTMKDPSKLEAPKDYEANLDFRFLIDEECRNDHEYRNAVMAESAENKVFFFDTFLWTFDPRFEPYDFPFITYDFQGSFINWLDVHIKEQEDGLVDKSRDMGVTWTILGDFYHDWLFGKGFLAHLGSQNEDKVDRTGDMTSLFEKLRYFIKRTPSWMLPNFDIKYMRMINNTNGNAITGESANKNWGRQGRYTVCFYDEFPVTEYADDIWKGAGDSTPCRLVVGTPNGTGNKFWRLRFQEMKKQNILSMHWSLHPRKAKGIYKDKDGKFRSPWYDTECQRRSPQEVAQELDIDYLASGNPFFVLKKVTEQQEWILHTGFKPKERGEYELGILAKAGGKVEFRPTPTGKIRIYEHPSLITQAVGFADPAEGLEHGDNSAIAVRCKKTGNLLAGVYGKIPPDELGELVLMLSGYYRNALCCAEMGGYGLAVNQYLWDHGANLFRDVDLSKGGTKEGKKIGFNTKRHRPEMLKIAEEEIRAGLVELRDKDLITECMNFINKNGKAQAAEGSCDDYIIAFAGAGLLMNIRPYSKMTEDHNLGRRRSVGGTRENTRPNMGFSFAGSGKPARRF